MNALFSKDIIWEISTEIHKAFPCPISKVSFFHWENEIKTGKLIYWIYLPRDYSGKDQKQQVSDGLRL